jgi:hypothetical protein
MNTLNLKTNYTMLVVHMSKIRVTSQRRIILFVTFTGRHVDTGHVAAEMRPFAAY